MSSFSNETKNELARIFPEKRCCQVAELSALLRLNGQLELTGRSAKTLCITTDNAGIARKAFKLFKGLFEFPLTVIMETKRRFNTNRYYQVRANLDEQHLSILNKLGLIDDDNRLIYGIKRGMVRKKCCKRAYLRGVFLARGSVSNPGSSYHLEMVFPAYDLAVDVRRLAESQGVSFRLTERKNTYLLYLKDSEQIVDFIRIMGANYALLEFENVRIYKSMRNQINRQVNCETANLEKTLEASWRQVENISRLIERLTVDGLPEQLRELAVLRLDYPDSSLKELGEMMSPPLSKSGVAYRMRKLEELSKRLS
ncbi:MAG: DNA-binding protein WhiA [Syntrophomonadaceae bacterium]|nr:DNA-binding protein WhiA [Syntrophomonadaceae bacterium]